MHYRLLMAALFALTFASASEAGPFRKSTKPDPATHVPLLIQLLNESKEERVRVEAASALREYDAKAYPGVLPALTKALTADPSPSVRAEAAESIGKVRPISNQAGYALEQSIANDKSISVRVSARAAMIQYRFLGFLSTKSDLAMQTGEPPLASPSDEKSAAGETVLRPTPSPIPVAGPVSSPKVSSPGGPNVQVLAPKTSPQTGEPPLAEVNRTPTLTSDPRVGTPVITIPPTSPSTITPIPTIVKPDPVSPQTLPADLEKPAAKPPAKSKDDGPTLPPPPPKS